MRLGAHDLLPSKFQYWWLRGSGGVDIAAAIFVCVGVLQFSPWRSTPPDPTRVSTLRVESLDFEALSPFSALSLAGLSKGSRREDL